MLSVLLPWHRAARSSRNSHAHSSLETGTSGIDDVIDGRDGRADRGRSASAAGVVGRTPVRHPARAGRAPAGVAAQAARHLSAGADAQARHRPLGRADARVQRGPRVPGDHVARDLRRTTTNDLRVLRQVRRVRGRTRTGVRRAHRSWRNIARRRVRGASIDDSGGWNVGRGQQAELWGDEQWQVLKTVIEERRPTVIGIDRSTVFAFSDGLSSGELQGMSAALGEQMDDALPQRRGTSAGAHRVAASGRGTVLPPDAGAGLVDDRDDVLVTSHHTGKDTHERSRVVVAPARQRSRPRHLVPAERRSAAKEHDRSADLATTP